MKTTQAPNVSKAPDVNSFTFCWRAQPGCPPAPRAQPRLRNETREPGMSWRRSGGGSTPSLECGVAQTWAELSGHVLWALCFAPWRRLGFAILCHPLSPRVPRAWAQPQHGPGAAAKELLPQPAPGRAPWPAPGSLFQPHLSLR